MIMGRGSVMLVVVIFFVSVVMGVWGVIYILFGLWVVLIENVDIYNVWVQNVFSYFVEGDVISKFVFFFVFFFF